MSPWLLSSPSIHHSGSSWVLDPVSYQLVSLYSALLTKYHNLLHVLFYHFEISQHSRSNILHTSVTQKWLLVINSREHEGQFLCGAVAKRQLNIPLLKPTDTQEIIKDFVVLIEGISLDLKVVVLQLSSNGKNNGGREVASAFETWILVNIVAVDKRDLYLFVVDICEHPSKYFEVRVDCLQVL